MKEVTVQELKKMMDNGEQFQLIDVREPYELDICNIGAKHIPMGQMLERLNEIDPDVPAIIHCRSGGRSGNIIRMLEMQKGLTNLYNLKGGILAWADEIDDSLEKY